MNLSNFIKEDNINLSNKLLELFNKSLTKISYFNLWYKISKFFWKNLELFTYKNSKKDFIFYRDSSWVENHISIYNALDNKDWSLWVVIEIIIWESSRKDIIFFWEDKIYNILENKWGKILESSIIEDPKKIYDILSFIEKDINYINNKTMNYQNKLRQKWVLNRQIREPQIERFVLKFKESILHLA